MPKGLNSEARSGAGLSRPAQRFGQYKNAKENSFAFDEVQVVVALVDQEEPVR